jgi:hypothetical protein
MPSRRYLDSLIHRPQRSTAPRARLTLETCRSQLEDPGGNQRGDEADGEEDNDGAGARVAQAEHRE